MSAPQILLVVGGWIVASFCAGVLIGIGIRTADELRQFAWVGGDDLIDFDAPYDELTEEARLRYVEQIWARS